MTEVKQQNELMKEEPCVNNNKIDPESYNNDAAIDPYEQPLPNGGFWAICTVIGSLIILLATFGTINAYGAYLEYYSSTMFPKNSVSDLSWPATLQEWLQFSLGTFSGQLFDQGYFRPMIIAGAILFIFCTFMNSLASEYYQVILAQGIGLGIAEGLLFVPAIAILSHYFDKRRGLATGIAITGSSLGGIIWTIMLNNLFPKIGFAWTVRAQGFILLGLIVIANFLMRTRLPPKPKTTEGSNDVRLMFKSVNGFIRDPEYLLLLFGGFMMVWGLFVPLWYLQEFAATTEVSENVKNYILAIMNCTSIFGRLVPPYLSDRFGTFNTIIPMCIVSAILCFSWSACSSTGGALAFALIYGFSSGGSFAMFPALIPSISDKISDIGLRVGFAFTVVGFAALTGSPIAGAILGPDYAWWKAGIFCGASIIAGTISFLWGRHFVAKRKQTCWV